MKSVLGKTIAGVAIIIACIIIKAVWPDTAPESEVNALLAIGTALAGAGVYDKGRKAGTGK